jgi:hypothetical protein
MITYNTVTVYEYATCWYLNGQYHREDGPAIEFASGNKWWYLNGNLHRTDGPAFEMADGSKSWYLNGERLTEAEFNERMNPVKELTVAEIELLLGYSVKVIS